MKSVAGMSIILEWLAIYCSNSNDLSFSYARNEFVLILVDQSKKQVFSRFWIVSTQRQDSLRVFQFQRT